MKVEIAPGLFADNPDLAAVPFWVWADNIRFRMALPETVGLFGYVPKSGGGVLTLTSTDRPRLWCDDGVTLGAAGPTVNVLNLPAGTMTTATLAGVQPGRWWFDSTETEIIAGKSGYNRVWVIPRDGSAPHILANSPLPDPGTTGLEGGIKCGGIVAEVLILAGYVQSYATNPGALLVRWSARRTDAPAAGTGFVGFEDWAPTNINASGEIMLGSGSKIIGGGASTFGFVVWTDVGMHLLTPRTDIYVFSEKKISGRGLLAQDAWVESEGKIWFYDTTRTLNVYDGGAVRQIPNPISLATATQLDPIDVDNCSMAAYVRFGEVILIYRNRVGQRRELVYNYLENTWYNWSLSRVALADEQGARPALGVDLSGQLYYHELPVLLPGPHTDPAGLSAPEVTPLGAYDVVPLPMTFKIASSRIPSDDMSYGALRATEMTLPHVVSNAIATPSGPSGLAEVLDISLVGVGDNSIGSQTHIDTQSVGVGEQQTSHRVAGKALRLVMSASNWRSHIRFGMADAVLTPTSKR